MNKKATDKIISVYWFTILFLVATAVVYMVSIFYSEPYDVRELEANALTNHVADCLVLNTGFLREEFSNEEFKENFLKECNLNFNTEDTYNWNAQGQYYLGVEFFREGNIVSEILEGNKNLISSCGIEKEIEDENIAKCVEREFHSLTSSGDVYSIKVLSIVRKTEKNA